MTRPFARRLQLVTGKGGTGKTTLVAALGLAHAARGKRPLLVELGHRASLSEVLAGPIAHAPREVAPGVHATNVDARAATQALVQRALPSRRMTTRALDAGPVRTFLDAAPGVTEIATLDRLRALVDETDFDPILVDGDATGHTKMLFALHDTFAALGVGGPLEALLDRMSHLFASPTSAAVHVASLPTRLAVEETLELWRALSESGRVAMGHVVLDRVEGLDARDLDPSMVAERERAAAGTPLASALGLLRIDQERWARAESLRGLLASHAIEALVAPEIDDPRLDVEALTALGTSVLDQEAP